MPIHLTNLEKLELLRAKWGKPSLKSTQQTLLNRVFSEEFPAYANAPVATPLTPKPPERIVMLAFNMPVKIRRMLDEVVKRMDVPREVALEHMFRLAKSSGIGPRTLDKYRSKIRNSARTNLTFHVSEDVWQMWWAYHRTTGERIKRDSFEILVMTCWIATFHPHLSKIRPEDDQ